MPSQRFCGSHRFMTVLPLYKGTRYAICALTAPGVWNIGMDMGANDTMPPATDECRTVMCSDISTRPYDTCQLCNMQSASQVLCGGVYLGSCALHQAVWGNRLVRSYHEPKSPGPSVERVCPSGLASARHSRSLSVAFSASQEAEGKGWQGARRPRGEAKWSLGPRGRACGACT